MSSIETGFEGRAWTRREVELVVNAYLHMLRMQFMGQRANKAEHNRQLQAMLPARTKASIEYKHCNISAVLVELGVPPLIGYKPLFNYQQLLIPVVSEAIEKDSRLDEAALRQVETPAEAPLLDSFEHFVVAPPEGQRLPTYDGVEHARDRPLIVRDYLQREARNRSLGTAGEELVMRYEAQRLHAAGARALADRIEHVSRTKGDGAGYDILSFEAGGRERFIEVKTTAYIAETPFYVSRNELSFSTEEAAQFHLYRLFDFRKRPRMFMLAGALDASCRLDPVSYRAEVMARG
ncbi:MAG TPA: DUF3883 domain-containing protein [Gemmataceae bacterium]|jgi:hypothetical protein|nr:DUF3883 domain-containing protein [Gemmataceae bacterium]